LAHPVEAASNICCAVLPGSSGIQVTEYVVMEVSSTTGCISIPDGAAQKRTIKVPC